MASAVAPVLPGFLLRRELLDLSSTCRTLKESLATPRDETLQHNLKQKLENLKNKRKECSDGFTNIQHRRKRIVTQMKRMRALGPMQNLKFTETVWNAHVDELESLNQHEIDKLSEYAKNEMTALMKKKNILDAIMKEIHGRLQ